MSTTYEIMKKAYLLDRVDKEFLFDNIEEILSIEKDTSVTEANRVKKQKDTETKKKELLKFKDRDIPKTKKIEEDPNTAYEVEDGLVPRTYTHMKGGTAPDGYHQNSMASSESFLKEGKKIHDPETKEHVENLLDKMEKFIAIDQDISYSNLSVFLFPLCKGARRVSLKKYHIVGLCKRMMQLSRSFEKAKKREKKRDQNVLYRQFTATIKEIRNKLSDIESKRNFIVVKAQANQDFGALENGIRLLLEQRIPIEEIKNRIRSMITMFDFNIEESALEEVINKISYEE